MKKEIQEWTNHCLIFRFYYNFSSRTSPQKSYKPSTAELIFGLISRFSLEITAVEPRNFVFEMSKMIWLNRRA